MDILNKETLGQLATEIETPTYNPSLVTSGIVHFGVGNFHRAHQAVYCDRLLNQGGTRWGITGVSMRSATMRDNLARQNYLYTQLSLGDVAEYRVIGSLKNILVASEAPQEVVDVIASQQTQLISMTITEKGYCLAQGEIDRSHPDIVADLKSLATPSTVYGYITAALIKRFLSGAPVTVLCCDNINAGGEHLQNGVQILLEQHGGTNKSDILQWVANHVAFAASMVDRVTPATTDALKQQVMSKLGVIDSAPVAAEPFTQWVIENNFAGARPPFDSVGAIFVDDIAVFERVKLRFLNAGHSIFAAMGYLAGDTYIHEALQREVLAKFTDCALKQDVLPIMKIPEGMNAKAYIEDVFMRFKNSSLPYACLQVGTDSSQKIQQRWLPSIEEALSQDKKAGHLAFALAAWVVFIRKALEANELHDPLRGEFAACLSAPVESDVRNFLNLAGAEQYSYLNNSEFMALVSEFHSNIHESGLEPALFKHMA